MKIKIWDRILAALNGLILFAAGACMGIYGLGLRFVQFDWELPALPAELWQRAVIVGAGVVLCLLGVHGISLLCRSRKEKGFILQHTEYGDLSISMHAMESMVKKCIDTHQELKVSNTRIQHLRDGVVVELRISLANGVNIPLTVSALQKQIKHYITSCSGVDVKEVRVVVETNNAQLDAGAVCSPADFMSDDVAAAKKAGSVMESISQSAPAAPQTEADEEPKEATHQRLFKPVEQPLIVPQPPEEASAEEPAQSEEEAPVPDECETEADEEAEPAQSTEDEQLPEDEESAGDITEKTDREEE